MNFDQIEFDCPAWQGDCLAILDVFEAQYCVDKPDALRGYDNLTKPNTVIGRGLLDPAGTDWQDLAQETLVMPGDTGDTGRGHNLNSYKTFSYGYLAGPAVDTENLWPQRYPAAWEDFVLGAPDERGAATFKFLDLSAAPASNPLHGHYIVLAHFPPGGTFPFYANKGFWEIVPQSDRFPTAAALRDAVLAANPAQNFQQLCPFVDCPPWRYQMTTGESALMLDTPPFGQMIGVLAADGSSTPSATYLFDSEVASTLQPNIQVWQVDDAYEFTGRELALAPGDGSLTVDNCYIGEALVLDSSDIQNPTRTTVPTASCATASASTTCDPAAPFDAPVPAFTGPANVDGLSLSPDQLTVYASGNAGGNYDIYYATRQTLTQPFGTLQPLPGPVNTPADERVPSISADGKRLYLMATVNNWHEISVAKRDNTSDNFAAPTPITSINSSVHDEDPFLWGSETLYFSSERPNAAHRDLYLTTFSGDTYAAPGLLSPVSTANGALNSNSEDYRPVLTADGLTLYFASKRVGLGSDTDGDIFMARRSSTSVPFAEPVVNLAGFNTSGQEFPVAVSNDGCTLYFAANRDTGYGNTNSFRLYQATRAATLPAQVTLTINIVGDGSLVSGPFDCHTGNVGTCSASAAPDTEMLLYASRQTKWTGICAGNGGLLSTDGIVVFMNHAECTLTFPNQ